MFQVYGIRHHGPGSARNILEALQVQQPDCILVEGPSDADSAIPFIGTDALEPPVSLVVYDPKDPRQASYYPFAVFSPEWQALTYANTAGIPARFIDLPVSLFREWEKQQSLRLALPPIAGDSPASRDPLGDIARLAGYEDGESWWDLMFERKPAPARFAQIAELMQSIRTELPGSPLELNTIREAWMREAIRQSLKQYHNIAVICGAFHGPALEATLKLPASADKKMLKGLKVKKMTSTWIPWTYERLAVESGYRAGVLSPAWYEWLFESPEQSAVKWMVSAARLLREKDLDASAAQVIDAIRLANTLSILRSHEIPGIHELQEAAVSVLGYGSSEQLDWLYRQTVIGEKMGKVSPRVPRIPLQEDIEKNIKAARLGKEWESPGIVEKKLDLRKPNQQEASILLCRMQLLGIPWGKMTENSPYNTGSFSEIWQLQRRPDFELLIIEAGVWGSTLAEACIEKTKHQIRDWDHLEEMSALLELSGRADLSLLTDILIQAMQQVAAKSTDIADMMQTVPRLAAILRYGQTRKTDRHAVNAILDSIFPRICIGLPALTAQLDATQAAMVHRQMLEIQRNLAILPQSTFAADWLKSLDVIVQLPAAQPALKGLATRLRFEQQHISPQQLGTEIHYAMSEGQNTTDTAFWIEGFLSGNSVQLLYQPQLWEQLNEWLSGLPDDNFRMVLPVLRRTFAEASGAERKKLLDAARFGLPMQQMNMASDRINQERETQIEVVIARLLGWPTSDKIR
ncbi:MAG: DUF5682 family protein [Saprospiraceae bacterium]|nr:DUF5682 family protein [Saprospiraceae bacterium]